MVGKLGRTIVVAFLVFVLVLSLGTANLVVGAERTVLNGDYVSDSLAEEEAYSVLIDEAQTQLEAETDSSVTQEGPAPEQLLSAVVTEAYLKNQTEANIDRAYAYLHGDREDLYLAINTTPLKDDLAAELASQLLDEQGLSEFDPGLAEMIESESAFESAREEFKAEQLARIQAETEPELTQEQLETAYEDRRDQIREEAIAELETRVEESDQPAELQSVLIDLGTLRIDALLDPDMTYPEFMSAVEQIRAELEEAVEQLTREQLDEELPDTMELTEELGAEEREQLDQLRGLVSILDLLVFVLPLVALGGALLIGWVARTRSSGLLSVGSAVTVTGLISALGFMGIGSRAETEIAAIATQGDMSAGLSDLVVGLLDRTVSVFVTQSWILVLLGILLIALGIAIRRELISIDDRPDQDTGASETAPENGGRDTAQPAEERSSVDISAESEDLEQEDPVGDVDGSGTDEETP